MHVYARPYSRSWMEFGSREREYAYTRSLDPERKVSWIIA
jgi:hypothetical protein